MTLGYLNAAIARGARLYSPVDICDIDAREDGVTLHSARGPEIRARHVVMATGYEMMKGIPRKGNRIISSRTEEHTSELQSLMRHSYAVLCLKTQKQTLRQQDIMIL